MNHAPKTHLTLAERDAAEFEATRLRALSLRQEAIDAFWAGIARAVRTAFASLTRTVFHTHKGA